MLADDASKFQRMWSRDAWKLAPKAGHGSCWGYDGNRAKHYFESALAGERCDVNWYEGATGTLGKQHLRPSFPKGNAPALLGFDDTIFNFCADIVKPHARDFDGDFNDELAHRCVAANQNILRLLSPRVGWNMCQNLDWVLCAVQGKLPGQGTRDMHFATAPKDLDFRVFEDPGRGKAWWMEPHEKHFAVSDVYFAEVAILQQICSNSPQLFTVEQGDVFVCNLDTAAFQALAHALLSGHGVH